MTEETVEPYPPVDTSVPPGSGRLGRATVAPSADPHWSQHQPPVGWAGRTQGLTPDQLRKLRREVLGLTDDPAAPVSNLILADRLLSFVVALAQEGEGCDPGWLLAIALIERCGVSGARGYFGG